MSSTTTSVALGQTTLPPTPSAHVQADFYAKLARLKQDIVTGRHPRHKFPNHIIEQYGLATTAPVDSYPVKPLPLSNGTSSQHVLKKPLHPSAALPPLNGGARLPKASDGRATPLKSSNIDPVLLTKSYDLVKAENHLKRLRIEKYLKEEAQSKKAKSGEKDNSGWNGAHTFNCADVLSAALLRVKPQSGLQTVTANGDRPDSSTPNTNSYYSSQAWSPDQDKDLRHEVEAVGNASHHSSFEDVVTESARRQPRVSGLGPSYESAIIDVSREDSYSPPSADSFPPAANRTRESESYSPPPAALGYHQPAHVMPQSSRNSHQAPLSNNLRKPQNMNGVRPTAREKRRDRAAKVAARHQVERVAEPGPKLNERKRKRENDGPQPATGMSARPGSPLPYIKSEPVSPPLQAARVVTEAPRRLVLRDDGTADIEVDAPPPATRRRITRDNTDLRRVASMQYARRVPSPLQPAPDVFYQQELPAPSPNAYQPIARPRYYHPDEQPPPASHIMRERHSSPLLVHDDFSRRSMMPPPSAPPKRKIVVDQYGNEYIAVPANSSMRQSVALEPEYIESPRYDRQSFFESAAPRYQQPIYAPSPRHAIRPPPEIIELDNEVEQPMPPPHLVPRRQRIVSNDPYVQQRAVYYEPQPHSQPLPRAVSMQPLPPPGQPQYRFAPTSPQYVQQQHDPMIYDRAVSARPNLAQQGGYTMDRAYGGYRANADFL